METKKDILGYASKIWATADTLRGVGIKESDFPAYMMPFFALMLLESRIVRMKKEKEKDKDLTPKLILEEIEEEGKGYNEVILKEGKLLKDICSNDKTFEQDFHKYLQSFDHETKELLGIIYSEGEKYLDLKGFYESLKSKKVSFSFVKDWSIIDLVDFDNSDVTTLEEHIKRKWSDISAETAGEQYTPDDIINLIEDIVIDRFKNEKNRVINVYDMTCGGGNMLFGVADGIHEKVPSLTINTYGQELNSQLYALAKIESRFREGSHISQGNTLLNDKFSGTGMDILVANPPYGVDWKNIKTEIENDKTGRYKAGFPGVSDGQLLFMQHGLFKLGEQNKKGMGFVVLNGSPLFSGDAGGGESEIRKWILDNDYLEALIQLPQDEFFNTNITTYLWVLNRNKPKDRKDKILLVNAEDMFVKLKKSKGKKNKEIDAKNRVEILKLLNDFKDTAVSKVMSKYDFYYNKQKVVLLNTDEQYGSVAAWMNNDWTKSIILKNVDGVLDDKGISHILETQYILNHSALKEDSEVFKKAALIFKEKLFESSRLKFFNSKTKEFILDYNNGIISYEDKQGYGSLDVKFKYDLKNKNAKIEIIITADTENDYEIIPYSPEESENKKNIDSFIKEWVERPYLLKENTVGVEINFNKIFYKKEELREIGVIYKEIEILNKEILALEKELGE